MPNSHIDDETLSSLLNQSEPPRSPRHLDESILNYAREQAEKGRLAADSEKQNKSTTHWYRQNWVPAAVTFSMAAIAVTLTLQNFGPEDFDRSATELSNLPEIALRDDLPEAVENTGDIRQRSVTELFSEEPVLDNLQTQQDDLQLQQANDAISSQAEAELIAESTDLAVRIITSSPALVTPSPQIETPIPSDDADNEIQDTAITTAADNGSDNSGASLAATDTPDTFDTLVETPSELLSQAPVDSPSQQGASALSQDVENIQQRRQRDEENTNATLANNIGTANASDASGIEKPDPNNSRDDGVTANQSVEEVIVTGSFIRSPTQTAAVSADTPSISELVLMLRADPDAQNGFLSLLERVLNPPRQTGSNNPARAPNTASGSASIFSGLLNRIVQVENFNLSQRREQLIELLEQRDESDQSPNLANRYLQLRTLADSIPTPETFDSAIELLELLDQ